MKRARLFVLVEGYLEGKLAPGERQELAAAVAADPQVAGIFVEQVRLARQLRAALHPRGEGETWAKISALVTPQEPERRQRLADRVDVLIGEGQRATARRATRHRWTAAGLMAAAAAVAAVMLLARGGGDRPPAPASPLAEANGQGPSGSPPERPGLPPPTEPNLPVTTGARADAWPGADPRTRPVPNAASPPGDARAAMIAELERAEGPALARRADVLAFVGFDGAWGRLPAWRGRLRPRFNELAPGLSGRGLRVSYSGDQRGWKGGGVRLFLQTAALTAAPSAPADDDIHLRYYVRLSDDFDFAGGGVLPGLCVGACLPARRAPAAEGRVIRLHWTRFGELAFDGLAGLESREPLDPGGKRPSRRRWDRFLVRGNWHALEVRVKLNTPGRADGVVEGWLDGDKALSLDGLRLREASGTHVEGVLFESLRRVRSAAPIREGVTTFDNVVVAGGYIGPRTASDPK